MTRVTLCGSLSLHPVSLGAGMHLAGYRALGLPFTYVPFKVTDVGGALLGMRALGIRGFGVSYPHKQAVMPHLDSLEPLARRIGAVNTIVNTDGHLEGHNTDWIGAVRALEEVTSLESKRVLLVGAGGAGSAIAHGVTERGARLVIANRDVKKGEALARDVGRGAEGRAFEEVERAGEYDVVVNATPMGMSDVDPRTPVPEGAFRAGQIVMDIVYKPLETELLVAAQRRGATVVHGGRMLLHQAARQFELYTGYDAPLAAMDEALKAAISPSP